MAEFGNFSVLALQDRVDRLEKALDAPDVTEAREHAKELVQDLEKEIELDQQAAERNRDEFKKDQDWKARLWPKNYKKNATFISTQIAAPEEEVVQDQRLLETARSLREQLGASPSERLLAFMRKQGERDGADIVAAGKRFVAALVKNLSLEKVKAFEREARGTLLRNEVSSGVAAEVLAPAGRQICTLLREALGNIEQGDAGAQIFLEFLRYGKPLEASLDEEAANLVLSLAAKLPLDQISLFTRETKARLLEEGFSEAFVLKVLEPARARVEKELRLQAQSASKGRFATQLLLAFAENDFDAGKQGEEARKSASQFCGMLATKLPLEELSLFVYTAQTEFEQANYKESYVAEVLKPAKEELGRYL